MKTGFISLPIVTRDGQFTAHYSEKGLAALNFPKAGKSSAPARQTIPLPRNIRQWHGLTVAALKQRLAGANPKKLPPFDWTEGTDFQKKVWHAMGRIQTGKTRSYGELADAIGHPKANRAVGCACGANPIPVLVPCHRVLAANKKIGGFSGGIRWKELLLEREGVDLGAGKPAV